MRASWVLLRKGSRMASSKWTQSQAQALRPKSKASTQARKLPSYSLWGHGPEGPSGFQSPGPSKKKNPRWKLAPPAGKETNTAGNRSKQVQAIPGEVTRTLYAPKEPSLRFGKSPRKELAPARRAGILSSPLSAERPSVPDGPLLQMVYEDKHYCFVSKPAGHSLAPGGMFMSQVHAHSISNRWERNKTVFQLCPGASGLVVLAKSNYGVLVRKRMRKVALRKSAHKKNVERTYLRTEFLAMVMGTPREEYGVIRGVVTKHENHYIVQPVQNGADVVLRYSVLGSNPHKTLGELSALSIVLVKGHTDHVRALLQQVLGTPIIGDTQYGGASMSWVEPYVRHDEEEEGKWGRLPDSRPPEGLPALLIPTRLNTLQLAAGGERTDIQPISGFATDLVNADVQEAASHLDIFQRFKASKYGENDDDYFVEFPAEEKENFPAEVEHQQLLKAHTRELREKNRELYDTDEDEERPETDCAPFCLHRWRMYYAPKPDKGHIYDVSTRPTWGSFLAIPDSLSDDTEAENAAEGGGTTAKSSRRRNPLLDDVQAFKKIIRMSLHYCDQDSDVDSDEETDDEY